MQKCMRRARNVRTATVGADSIRPFALVRWWYMREGQPLPYGGCVAITMRVNGTLVGEAFRLPKSCDLMLYKTGGETPPLRRYNNDLRINPPLVIKATLTDRE